MWHPGFNHRKTSSINLFLPGGKLAVFTGWKRANCEFIHGCIFIQWINCGHVAVANDLTFRKLFESGTYNDTKNEPTTSHPMKDELKIHPLDQFAAPEGYSE